METRPPKRARASCSPWPALPPDIAGEVLLRLRSYADRICFGAVCRPWRRCAAQHPLLPRLPCLVFAHGTFRGFPGDDRPFRLPAAAGYYGSSGEWLIFRRDDGTYTLANPFSNATAVAPLPSLSSVRARREPVGAVDGEGDVPEYDVQGLVLRELPVGGEPEPRTVSLRKLVVCSPDLVAAVIGEGRLGTFALCRPGAASWSVSSHDQWRRLKDMAVHQGELYAVDHNEDLLVVTVGEDSDGAPRVTGVGRVIEGAPPDLAMHRRVTLHYLVDSGDALLMMRREVCLARPPGRGRDLDERLTVFKADFRSSRWATVSTLGDGVALFVGPWCSRAVRVPDDERREEWAGRVFFLEDGASQERQLLQWSQRYSLSAYDVTSRRTHSVLPAVRTRDGDELPATWLFPPDHVRA
ncbi:hypothetical protein ACP70R_029628 [Stipagrostis hirtigluma subsp. patula]